MGKHVAAEDGLTVSELVDLALAGGPVTITRGGRAVAEIASVPHPATASDTVTESGFIDILRAMKAANPCRTAKAASLVREMRDEGP